MTTDRYDDSDRVETFTEWNDDGEPIEVIEPVIRYAVVERKSSLPNGGETFTKVMPMVQTDYEVVFGIEGEAGDGHLGDEYELLETFPAPDNLYRVMEVRNDEWVQTRLQIVEESS